jgi:hypothetical protein
MNMKRRIYNRIKEAWTHDIKKMESSDRWINSYILLSFRTDDEEDIKNGFKCEFCVEDHLKNQSLCPISCKGHPDGNDFESAFTVKLSDIVDKINMLLPGATEIKLGVSILATSKPDW